MSRETTVRAFYRAIDAGDDDALAALLAPTFVHDRPDRTIDGRTAFVRFMREERPRTDTEHAVDAVYVESDGADCAGEIAVRGRLLGDDGAELFGFVDAFEFATASEGDDDPIVRLTTYTD
ncbi:ketosteroid isomerase [Halobacteriales archaeon QS_6_71_20]|nr:MAG: ketosteroid isomerase [Halobacteriales archaeon QS_6_71_20]